MIKHKGSKSYNRNVQNARILKSHRGDNILAISETDEGQESTSIPMHQSKPPRITSAGANLRSRNSSNNRNATQTLTNASSVRPEDIDKVKFYIPTSSRKFDAI